MHDRGPFANFTRELDELAASWPEHHPDIPAISTPAAFNAVPPLVLATLKSQAAEHGHALPDKLTNHNAQHGLSVVTRYIAHAAIRAQRDSLNLNEFSSILTHEASFEPLAAIASTQRKLAFRTEMEYGLGRTIDMFEPYVLDRYKLGTAVTLDDLDGNQESHRKQLTLNGEEMYEGKCAAHRSDSLRTIYRHMTNICLRDSALVPAALSVGPVVETQPEYPFKVIRL